MNTGKKIGRKGIIKVVFMFALFFTVFAVPYARVHVNAEENIEVLEVEEGIKSTDSFCFIEEEMKQIDVETTEDTKIYKIEVPEYSAYFFEYKYKTETYRATTYLTKDDKKTILMDEDDSDSYIFLPKGTYYFFVENIQETIKNNEKVIFWINRITVENFMKGEVINIKQNKNYYYYCTPYNGMSGSISCSAKPVDGNFSYDEIYHLKPYISFNKKSLSSEYIELDYIVKVKKGTSKTIITPCGVTADVLKAEKKGGTYTSSKTSSSSNTTKTSSNKDTKAPTVTGVKNNKTYKKNVKFKVSDKSGIKKVTLKKNSSTAKKISVTKAKKGYTVKKNGKYTLKVWDKAGNQKTLKFAIKK